MAGRKIRLGVLCGGPSPEHRISLLSSRNILAGAISGGFQVVVLGVDTDGRWLLYEDGEHLVHADDPNRIALAPGGRHVTPAHTTEGGGLVHLTPPGGKVEVDVVFPVLHGPYGEDGTVQGMLRASGIPFVGCGVTASALCMDKDHAKCILRGAGLPVADWITVRRHGLKACGWAPDTLFTHLGGQGVFVKPANMGSSVGITRVDRPEALEAALHQAFEFDSKVLIEAEVRGRELECSVLGNEAPEASGVGEIVVRDGFYSYEAKYLDDHAAVLHPTADLEEEVRDRVRALAVDAFGVLGCRGLARVDFFLREDGAILVNEVNTMPGFTRISMYPKLWELSGLPIDGLIHRLVDLALKS